MYALQLDGSIDLTVVCPAGFCRDYVVDSVVMMAGACGMFLVDRWMRAPIVKTLACYSLHV